jgi:hypothetical protein
MMKGDTKTATPATYKAGSIKQQSPSFEGIYPHSHAHIAVRTSLPNIGDPNQDWFCMCPYTGGHLTGYDEVQNWADIWIAP